MNTTSSPSFSRSTKAGLATRPQAPIIELVTAEMTRRHPWLRALSLGALGLLGILLLFILIRLFLVGHLQGEMLDPLGRVVRRLDLSAGARRLVWYATFACSALSLGLVMRRLAHVLLPLPIFRLSVKESALLFCLFGIPMLAPDIAKKVCPVREVNPVTAAWFDESEDGSTEPHGLIGYVHEVDGSWWFCNVRGGPRPSDGAPIAPVTRAVRQEWEIWQKGQRERMERQAEAARQQSAAKAAEQQRLRAEAAEKQAAVDRVQAERKKAEADAERAAQDRLALELRLQEQKKEAAAAEAHAAAERIRAAQTWVMSTPYGKGSSVPQSPQVQDKAAAPQPRTSAAAAPPHTSREILLDEPLRLVQAGEVPYPWRHCNHCGRLPASHVWVGGRMRCPLPENCHNCRQPLRFHRHIREKVDGTVRDRIACPRQTTHMAR